MLITSLDFIFGFIKLKKMNIATKLSEAQKKTFRWSKGENVDWSDEREFNVWDEIRDFLYLYKYQIQVIRLTRLK